VDVVGLRDPGGRSGSGAVELEPWSCPTKSPEGPPDRGLDGLITGTYFLIKEIT
jgi:hypothetical protein